MSPVLTSDLLGSMTEITNETVAVLTGGGSGIGRATAHALAHRGSKVITSDIDVERAKVVAAEIEANGGQAEGVRCDVSLAEDVTALAEAALRAYGRIDIVMSNVGVIAKGDPLAIPIEAWNSIIDINLLATVRVFRPSCPSFSSRVPDTWSLPGRQRACSPTPTTGSPTSRQGSRSGAHRIAGPVRAASRDWRNLLCPAGVITNILEQIRQYGPATPVQTLQLGVISAEDAGELVVQGILEDKLLVLTDPLAETWVQHHAADRNEFLTLQIQHLEGLGGLLTNAGRVARRPSLKSRGSRHRIVVTTTSPMWSSTRCLRRSGLGRV